MASLRKCRPKTDSLHCQGAMTCYIKAVTSIKPTPTPVPSTTSRFRAPSGTQYAPQNNPKTTEWHWKTRSIIISRSFLATELSDTIKPYCHPPIFFSTSAPLIGSIRACSQKLWSNGRVWKAPLIAWNTQPKPSKGDASRNMMPANEQSNLPSVCTTFEHKEMARSLSRLKSGQWAHWNIWMLHVINSTPRSTSWPCSPGLSKMLCSGHKRS
jgi:hypothetical protein